MLTDVNLTIHSGEFVAIAGSSGSGKTTLLNLIPRYFDVTGGQLLVDNIDVRNVQLGSLRETIGLVRQESYLFDGTVRENLL
ncbi:MAG: ATP-binding cassette domain-containing protein, partial [Verrucomicrobiaceae bacterium]|nr:ATP-binding cassette domain-containing protein [Verrucomicrobiaceae bacterium]